MSDSNPTTEDLEKSLSLSNSQSKALKKLTQKWGEMMDSTKEELHRETKYPFLYYLLRVSLLGIPLWLLYAQ